MSDSILDEAILKEEEALISADEMVAHLIQDIILDNEPSELVDEFIEEFVIRDRPETAQILGLLEMPAETIVDLLKGIANQGYQLQIDGLNSRGVSFVGRLKSEIRDRMTVMAAD